MSKDRKLVVAICTLAVLFAVVIKCAPAYFFTQGKMYLKKQDYVNAYGNLKNAYNLDKSNKDYRYYYVQALLQLSPNITVQKALFEIASSSQDDSARYLAEKKVYDWKSNIMVNIGDNYIEQAPTDKGIMRWDTKNFPLKIAVIDNSETTLPSYYNEEIFRAFRQWESSTSLIQFATTQNASNAKILVIIKPLPNDVCDGDTCRYVVGYTTPNIKGHILNKMTIILYATDPHGNFFSDKELYNTALHEIGHALGIMGHSYSSDDLMYMASNTSSFYTPYRSSFQYLSSKDINTVKLLYRIIPEITDSTNTDTKGLVYAPIILGSSKDISLRKLKEAQNYVKKAPDLANGYMDMGIAYAELNKHNEAVKAILKAYELSKTDNEKYLSLYNLAAIYQNKGEFDNALKYASEAQNITDTEEIKDLISNIKHAKVTKRKLF